MTRAASRASAISRAAASPAAKISSGTIGAELGVEVRKPVANRLPNRARPTAVKREISSEASGTAPQSSIFEPKWRAIRAWLAPALPHHAAAPSGAEPDPPAGRNHGETAAGLIAPLAGPAAEAFSRSSPAGDADAQPRGDEQPGSNESGGPVDGPRHLEFGHGHHMRVGMHLALVELGAM